MNAYRNINRLLENSKRSDIWGYNIYSRGKSQQSQDWDAPSLGLPGNIAIGHMIDTENILVPQIFCNGQMQHFIPQRNHWTPAFMDSYYRSAPSGEYAASGLLAVRETKCFTENDVFVAQLTLTNDSREPMEISLELAIPYPEISLTVYQVDAKVLPRSIRKNLTLKGFLTADFSCEWAKSFLLPPQSSIQLRYGFAFSNLCAKAATDALAAALATPNPFADAENRFNQWMADHAPLLEIENEDLLKIYYYRFFVIKCGIHEPRTFLPDSVFEGSCVYESPFGSWFGAPIGLSIPFQIEEMKWMKDSTALRSHIQNWCNGYGAMQSYIQFTPMAIWHFYLQTRDLNILTDYYRHARDFTISHTPKSGETLPKTTGSWLTGAEYQPSFYQYTTPAWDWRHDQEGAAQGFEKTVLYRVDECAMHAANLFACKQMAEQLGAKEDADFFASHAEAAFTQIQKLLWNENEQFFFDFDVATAKPCDQAYSYDGFTPLMFGLFGSDFHGVFRQLNENGRFDGGFGITSIGKDCPMYWFDNCITGPTAADLSTPHHYSCCWNGPIWPFAVSLVLEALGSSLRESPNLSGIFSRIFTQYTQLHFACGDRSVPCIREHYRPSDGTTFSPYTEYFHSQWINLFISYYLGISVTEDSIRFCPATEECFILKDVVIQGKHYRFAQEILDGKLTQTITEQ